MPQGRPQRRHRGRGDTLRTADQSRGDGSIDTLNDFYARRQTAIEVLDHRLALVRDRIVKRSPASVLDIACGRGTLLRALRQALPSATLMGVDISSESVDAVRAQGFEAQVSDIAAGLPFANDSFDCVSFCEVIEHLVDPDRALQEIARVLKIGGTLVITTPNMVSWFNRILVLFGIQPVCTETSLHTNLGRRFRALGQWNVTQGHLKIFTLPALREMLAGNGFDVRSSDGSIFYPPNKLTPLDRLFTRIPVLAANLVVVSRNSGSRRTSYPLAVAGSPES